MEASGLLTIPVLNDGGEEVGSVELAAEIFGIEPRPAVMHQVVTAQLAARRSGTHSTKTRSEVRGGGSKPRPQKGTGRSRHGSIRSPIWRGGGIAHGPKPRSYAQKTPKKMKRLALRSALSDRASSQKIIVVDAWRFDKPSTAEAVHKLRAVGAQGRVLVVLDRPDELARKSFRNIPRVNLLPPDQLNTYDVLLSDRMVFTETSLASINEHQPDDHDQPDEHSRPDDEHQLDDQNDQADEHDQPDEHDQLDDEHQPDEPGTKEQS